MRSGGDVLRSTSDTAHFPVEIIGFEGDVPAPLGGLGQCYGWFVSARVPISRALAILGVTFVAAAVAHATLTNHKIVLGRSIGDVSVGMTRAHVERLLGHGLLIGRKGVRVELWSKLGLTFFFKGSVRSAKNFGGETSNPAYDAPQSIRVTSTTAEVESAYPSLHCTDSQDSNPNRPWKSCTRHGPAGRVTIFYFDAHGHGDVTRIAVGAGSIASMP
jgi:hypothetical protein